MSDERPETLHIRPVRIEDAEAINEIRLQPTVLYGTLALPSERIASNRAHIEAFGINDHVLVAELDGHVVGMVGLHVRSGKQRHTASTGIMVHEEFQNRGIGRKLMADILEIADDYLGLVRVELEVLPDNDRAIRLYESLGFVVEGRKLKAHWGARGFTDILVMGRVR